MLKRILSYWESNAILIAIGVTLSITIGSLINPKYIKATGITVSDKIVHLGAYFVLMVTWLMYNRKRKKPIKAYILYIGLLFFGIIIEVLQDKTTVFRTGDYLDVIANTLGLTMALFCFKILFKK